MHAPARPSPTPPTASGINIPLDCRDGACGTCKCLCESGRYDGGDYIEDALTEDEAAEGYASTCQMKPEIRLVVLRIAASSEMCKTEAHGLRGDDRGDRAAVATARSACR